MQRVTVARKLTVTELLVFNWLALALSAFLQVVWVKKGVLKAFKFCGFSLVRALSPNVVIQTRYTMALYVVYWLHTCGFSFDRPLLYPNWPLHSCTTSRPPAAIVQPKQLLYIYYNMVSIYTPKK